MGTSLAGGPLLVSTMTSKTCYDLLLSRNPALPHCVGKFLPLFGAWEWSSTWCSLFFKCKNVDGLSPPTVKHWQLHSFDLFCHVEQTSSIQCLCRFCHVHKSVHTNKFDLNFASTANISLLLYGKPSLRQIPVL